MNRRSFLILSILLIIALTGISFWGGSVTYTFLMLTVLVPVSSFVYILLVISSLKIYQRSDGRTMTASVPSDFYITLNNETFFSFSSVKIRFYSSFSTVSGLIDDIEYELAPHSSITRATKLVCKYRGEYRIGIKEITIRDFLGLFAITFPIKEPLEVIVAPAMVRPDALRLDAEFIGAGKDSFTNPSDTDITVREYVPGDDVRLIHHKASAVMRKPMVRQRVGTEKTGVAVIMEAGRYSDLPEDYLPVENRIIESTLALALYYVERSIPVDVMYHTGRTVCEAVRTYADYERLYASMRSYSFQTQDDTVSLLEELTATGRASEYLMLYYILCNEDAAVCELVTKASSDVPYVIYAADKEPAGDTNLSDDGSPRIVCIGTQKATEDVL